MARGDRVSGVSSFVSLALDMARGLAYLHAQQPPIVHRDVALRNFLVSSSGSVMISDFGLARKSAMLELDAVSMVFALRGGKLFFKFHQVMFDYAN